MRKRRETVPQILITAFIEPYLLTCYLLTDSRNLPFSKLEEHTAVYQAWLEALRASLNRTEGMSQQTDTAPSPSLHSREESSRRQGPEAPELSQ